MHAQEHCCKGAPSAKPAKCSAGTAMVSPEPSNSYISEDAGQVDAPGVLLAGMGVGREGQGWEWEWARMGRALPHTCIAWATETSTHVT